MTEMCNECLQKPILDGCAVTYCERCGKKIITLHTPGDSICMDCIKEAQKDGVHLCKCCGKEISVIPTDNYEKTVVKPTGRSRAYLRRVKKRTDKRKRRIIKILQTKSKPDELGVSDKRKTDRMEYED